jgi:hypothetical protein
MRIRSVFDFNDDDRAAIALYMHRRYDEPLRKLATRKQCQSYIHEAMNNQDISCSDVAALETHCARCDS